MYEMGLRQFSWCGKVLIWGSLGFVWLFALRSCEWSNIGLACTIPTHFRAAISTQWGHLLTPIDSIDGDAWDLGLIGASSADFLPTLRSQQFNGPHLVWLSDSPRRFHKLVSSLGSPPDLNLVRCSHKTVGGVTSSIDSFVSLGIPPFSKIPLVQRTLSSIIDHKAYLPPGTPLAGDLTLNDRLNVKHPFQPVVIPCRFSSSGFGRRSLSFGELCMAWDFPLWCTPRRVTKSFFSAVSQLCPMKSLVYILDQTIASMDFSFGSPIGLPSLAPLPVPVTDPRGTWLPALNAWLPPTWIDESLVTEKAVKVDASDIPIHLWNLCISLVLNSPVILLDRLRDFMHAIACRRVRRSFCQYMMRRHGRLWTTWVVHGATGGFFQQPGADPDVSELDLRAFARDLQKGRDALGHYLDSSWWKWRRGSALLF